MSNSISYSGINTKVKAMSSKLINKDDYTKIVSYETVADLIIFLKNHPGYLNIFERYNEKEVHREEAERLFINGLYLDYAKLYRFGNEEQRLALKLVFFRYEVNVIKACIRLIYNKEDAYDLSLFHPFFSKHSQINVTALSSSHSMEEYVQNLKGTQYFNMFEKMLAKGNATSFDYEMQLDVYFFTKSWRLKEKMLDGENRKSFTTRIGTEIDMNNIMWIYRSKLMYDRGPAEIFAYLIPINYKLTQTQLSQLVNAVTINDFSTILNNTRYQSFYHAIKNGNMENEYNKAIDKIYKMNTRIYPNSMSQISYYLFLKDAEIANLTTAIECIRYHLEPKDKMKYILHSETM